MGPDAARTRGRRQIKARIATAVTLAAATTSAGTAFAADGGGVTTPEPPLLDDFQCISTCAGLKAATEGSRIEFSGQNLDRIADVRFAAATGGRIAAPTRSVAATRVEARVPAGAATGTVILSGDGASVETVEPLQIVAPSAIPNSSEFKLGSAEATPRRSFFDAARGPRVSYAFTGGGPTDVRIEVVNRTTKATVASFVDAAAEPNTTNVAVWDGRTSTGAVAENGRYRFRIGSAAGGTAKATAKTAFGYHKFRFPIAAKHRFGDGFGAGRDHQGQDVFARCGTKMRAARGGRVQVSDVHPAAGNYVVIDGKGTGADHLYAHMLKPSPLAERTRVRTGQVVGFVGQSGNASGCHLHFEVWSAPGYYEGGAAMPSVGTMLKTWDGWS